MALPEQASPLTDRIAQVDSDSFETWERSNAEMIRQAATLIATLAGDNAVVYLDHNKDTDDERTNGTMIVAFTEKTLLILELKRPQGLWEISTRAIPRDSLRDLQVERLSSAIGASAESWPSAIRVKASYGEAVTLRLPFRAASFPAQRQELAALLATLVTDLNN